MNQVTVRVPASTSNLGSGFDCLGLALRLYNTVQLRLTRVSKLPPMVREAATAFFEASGMRPFRFGCTIRGDVPVARGLGSSVTVRLGVLIGLNKLSRAALSRQRLFELCAKLEGHGDNTAPALFGGFAVVHGNRWQRCNVLPRLKVVLLVPDFEVATKEARKVLPKQIAFRDAVDSTMNATSVVAAFVSKNYAKLRGSFNDQLHQPTRKNLIPFFDDVIAAAENSGALGAFLSGSGSTIAALTLADPDVIAAAMLEGAKGHNCRVIVTSADNQGATVLR